MYIEKTKVGRLKSGVRSQELEQEHAYEKSLCHKLSRKLEALRLGLQLRTNR